eukprot:gene3398-6750_t
MSLLKQITDKGAVLSWSPIANHSNMVALGTKDSSGLSFDDYGGELEIHRLDFADNEKSSSEILGRAKTTSRFASIAWSQMATRADDYPYGLIAGGMVDGSIHIWDSAKLVEQNEQSLLASLEQHQGPIHGLQFNPHKESSHLLASGGSDGEVFVMALDHPETPNVFIPAPPPNNTKHTADITKIAWNSQVAHILASSSQNGSCIIWDLRQKKAWCELRDPTGGCVSDVAWNPDQGLHLVTASGEDRNPVIKLWDLRSSTSLPLATLQGHTEGVLSVSWCPTDSSLLLSCGKDNKTILWDLFHLQPVYDLPSVTSRTNAHIPRSELSEKAIFGSLASSAVQKRFHVSWSPCLPAVVAACSFDRNVQFYSLAGVKSRLGRAPKWLRKPVGAAFGFGGKIVYFNNKENGGDNTQTSPMLKMVLKEEDPSVGAACDLFHNALATGDFKGYCDHKANDDTLSDQDRRVWSLMKVICFEKNAREELLTHLGFDSNVIAATAHDYVESKREGGGVTVTPLAPPPPPSPTAFQMASIIAKSSSPVTAEALFGAAPPDESTPPEPLVTLVAPPILEPITIASPPQSELVSPQVSAMAKEMAIAALAGLEAEPTIRQALVVGNFAAAVDCCLEAGLMAEALLLAQCGDPALCNRTQNIFFERQKNKKPFLQILHAIIKGELMELVLTSEISKWKETLALLSTYGKSEEFPTLCEALASRLENEQNDIASATLCYMCATNVERVVHFWAEELKVANAIKGRLDNIALQQFVEKVVMYTQSNPMEDLGSECSKCFSLYASLLASQGRLDVAPNYVRGEGVDELILRDRIYHATAVKPEGARPPVFPFQRVDVKEESAQPVVTKPAATAVGATSYTTAASPGNVMSASPLKVSPKAKAVAAFSGAAVPQPVAHSHSQQQQQQQSSLPAGWLQLVDPASGRQYYVNQANGQSQWEPPAMPHPTPQSVPTAASPMTPQQSSVQTTSYSPAAKSMGSAAALPVTSGMGMATGYGAGGAAAATPNAGAWIPNAATVAAKPQPMHQQQHHQQQQLSAAEPVPVAVPKPLMPVIELASVATLEQIVSIVAGSPTMTPGDKRQLAMVSSCIAILREKAGVGEVGPEIQEQLDQLVLAMNSRNFIAANAIQTALATTAWGQHKEWIKGLKATTITSQINMMGPHFTSYVEITKVDIMVNKCYIIL